MMPPSVKVLVLPVPPLMLSKSVVEKPRQQSGTRICRSKILLLAELPRLEGEHIKIFKAYTKLLKDNYAVRKSAHTYEALIQPIYSLLQLDHSNTAPKGDIQKWQLSSCLKISL